MMSTLNTQIMSKNNLMFEVIKHQNIKALYIVTAKCTKYVFNYKLNIRSPINHGYVSVKNV